MKIRDIEVVTLRFEYPRGGGFRDAGGYCTGRASSLVRVHTDEGISGIGSIYSHPDLVRVIVEGQLAPMLVGQDPLRVEALWESNYNLTRWYGRKGVAMSSLGGVDMALWDIRGKVAGKPICELLGKRRERVPAYASALLWRDDPAELGEEAAGHLERGFRAMKTRLGRNFAYDRDGLRSLRDALGSENRLMVDGNARYSLGQAERMAPLYNEAEISWLEEPFAPEDFESYAALRPKLRVPLAAGENEFGVQGFRELMDRNVVDIVQPDCCRAGGITECARIAGRAAAEGRFVATHTWSDAVALTANLHLLASLEADVVLEIDQTGNALIDDLLSEGLALEDGEVAVPDGPGLGIALNEDVVERYRHPAGEPFPGGNYADMIFGAEYRTPPEPYTEE